MVTLKEKNNVIDVYLRGAFPMLEQHRPLQGAWKKCRILRPAPGLLELGPRGGGGYMRIKGCEALV